MRCVMQQWHEKRVGVGRVMQQFNDTPGEARQGVLRRKQGEEQISREQTLDELCACAGGAKTWQRWDKGGMSAKEAGSWEQRDSRQRRMEVIWKS